MSSFVQTEKAVYIGNVTVISTGVKTRPNLSLPFKQPTTNLGSWNELQVARS